MPSSPNTSFEGNDKMQDQSLRKKLKIEVTGMLPRNRNETGMLLPNPELLLSKIVIKRITLTKNVAL